MQKITSYSTQVVSHTEIFLTPKLEDVFTSIELNSSIVVYLVDQFFQSHPLISKLENIVFIPSGEDSKSISCLEKVISSLQNYNLDKSSHIIVIGGGSLSDLGGFIASIYLRGIPLSIIPTTLLSLIDASIGGKNGLNFDYKKNQLGTIYQPRNIIFSPELIDTLSDDELSDGFAEIIKYGLIGDISLFEYLEHHTLNDFRSNQEFQTKIINSCIIQKSSIVEKDSQDLDLRRILNFGHTIGHGIESEFHLSHGKSVALGMIIAAHISESVFKKSGEFVPRIRKLLSQYHIPISLDQAFYSRIIEKIQGDKKRDGSWIHFILISKLGHAEVQKIPFEQIRSYLKLAEQEKWI